MRIEWLLERQGEVEREQPLVVVERIVLWRLERKIVAVTDDKTAEELSTFTEQHQPLARPLEARAGAEDRAQGSSLLCIDALTAYDASARTAH